MYLDLKKKKKLIVGVMIVFVKQLKIDRPFWGSFGI